jgi:hypothetical protein
VLDLTIANGRAMPLIAGLALVLIAGLFYTRSEGR